MTHGLLWVPFTLTAAFAQVLRNAVQSRLTARIGTVGGTQVRFVYGLPFAAILLAIYLLFVPSPIPPIPAGPKTSTPSPASAARPAVWSP